MHIFLALPYYLSWHYTTALYDMIGIWRNFFYFIYNFFSISLLLRTLFSPWHRIKESYAKIEDFFGNLVVNTLMRLVGAVIRMVFIVMGTVSLLLCLIFGVAAFIFWLVLPFLLVYTFFQGINLLTK